MYKYIINNLTKIKAIANPPLKSKIPLIINTFNMKPKKGGSPPMLRNCKPIMTEPPYPLCNMSFSLKTFNILKRTIVTPKIIVYVIMKITHFLILNKDLKTQSPFLLEERNINIDTLPILFSLNNRKTKQLSTKTIIVLNVSDNWLRIINGMNFCTLNKINISE